MTGLPFRDPVSSGTHLLWFLLAIPATVVLWRRCRGDRPKQWSMAVFGLTMIFCFGASALFHAVRLQPDQVKVFELIDYIGIFLFVAGSCTPIAYNLLEPRWRWPILQLAWGLALTGITLRLLFPAAPHWVFTLLYFALGWGVMACYYEVMPLPLRVLRPVLVGGVLYTVGGVLNALRWPVLWPGLVASHEVFHLFVMAGSLVHFGFMLDVVVPWRRVEPEPLAEPASAPA